VRRSVATQSTRTDIERGSKDTLDQHRVRELGVSGAHDYLSQALDWAVMRAIAAESSGRNSGGGAPTSPFMGRAGGRPRQLILPEPSTWGGSRKGAGRKPQGRRTGPPHAPRPEHDQRHPVHATLRGVSGLPSFRSEPAFCDLSRALAACSQQHFRLLQFSAQSDHLHLIVEADSTLHLSRGLQGLAIRCARAINRAAARRGTVWHQRYHIHALLTPREVRSALVYVLLNFRKHLRAAPGIDPFSSGPWFDGWAHQPTMAPPPAPVVRAQTWLGAIGWRRAGGSLDCRETPAAPAAFRRQAA
jgi:putative transposase